MNISLNSHLLPLQPPFPLIYVGKPYYKVVRQLATLIMPRAYAQSEDFYASVPVIDDNNNLCGIVYNQAMTEEGSVLPLLIKEGDKNIPWENILHKACMFENDKLDSTNTVEYQVSDFAQTLETSGCTIKKPDFVTIMVEIHFDNDAIVAVTLHSKEIPFVVSTIFPSLSIDDCEKLSLFVNGIHAYTPLLGNFKIKIECENESLKPELQETIDKILERIEYEFDVADGKYINLSEWKDEEIREELLWVQKNASSYQMGSDSKSIILNALGKRMAVHQCDFPKLWDVIISNNWVWFDEYTGMYKISICDK